MQNNIDVLQQIISLADFSAIDSILYHHYFNVYLILLGLLFFSPFCLVNPLFHNKILLTLLFINSVITAFASLAVFSFGKPSSIELRTTLNEQQTALLKTIDDPKIIQAINYNVAKYGKNLYAIEQSLSKTDATLEEIEKEKVIIKEKQRLVNPPKFLELKTN